MTTSPSLPDPTDDSSPLGQPRRWFWVGPICLAVVVLDQLTKIWAVSALTKPIDVIWTLRLRVTRNPGAAFSTGTGIGPLIGVAAVVIVLFLLRSGRNTVNRAALVALGLVSGGAIGNLIDRAARSDSGFLGGHVGKEVESQRFKRFLNCLKLIRILNY